MLDPTIALVPGGEEGVFAFLTLLFFGGFACLALLMTVFWVWMIVDCATNEKSEGNDKIVWILVVVLGQWIGALVYFFARRPVRRRELGR